MIKANFENISKWLNGMDNFNSTKDFGTTRILFTKPEIENRNYVKNEMRLLGLEVTEDAIGNIFATLKGEDSSLAPVWTGSHIDTVPNAGKFDGMAGVVAGLEAVNIIKQNQLSHKRDIVVLVYTSEEPTRYGLSCLGSRAMSGDLDLELTKNLFDKDDKSLHDKLLELGYNMNEFSNILKNKGDVYASVELHIEQNDSLEKSNKPIAIVDKICAPSNYLVELTGFQSHAGGTSMQRRRDAFVGVCEMSLLLEKLANECQSEYNTATVGYIENIPNAVNVISGKCNFSVDIRDCNKDTKDKLIKDFKHGFYEIAKKRELEITITDENDDVPLTCNSTIKKMLEQSCAEFNLEYDKLISGPYHDTLFVGKFTPSAMIFVPSKKGISHSPYEWTNYEDIAKGTDLLADVLIKLANSMEEL